MMISTRGRYALRVMIDLAEHVGVSYIPLKDIAERQQISEKYLESIVKVLVRNGLLDALRGKGGGYRLNRAPAEYTVGNILRLTEGNLAPNSLTATHSRISPRRISPAMTLSSEQIRPPHASASPVAEAFFRHALCMPKINVLPFRKRAYHSTGVAGLSADSFCPITL